MADGGTVMDVPLPGCCCGTHDHVCAQVEVAVADERARVLAILRGYFREPFDCPLGGGPVVLADLISLVDDA